MNDMASDQSRGCIGEQYNMTEILDIVDGEGNPTGETVSREIAHRDGIRHRTSHVWILRHALTGEAEILLQKRSTDKDSFPGCYDISSAGHIPAGQSFAASAIRELQEELNLTVSEDALCSCGLRRFSYTGSFHNHIFLDNQVSMIYGLWYTPEMGDIRVQIEEIESVLWLPIDTCVEAIAENRIPHCIYMEELHILRHGMHI